MPPRLIYLLFSTLQMELEQLHLFIFVQKVKETLRVLKWILFYFDILTNFYPNVTARQPSNKWQFTVLCMYHMYIYKHNIYIYIYIYIDSEDLDKRIETLLFKMWSGLSENDQPAFTCLKI